MNQIIHNYDELSDLQFKCMTCGDLFTIEQGTFPQNDNTGKMIIESDLNNRSVEDFMCYDCAG